MKRSYILFFALAFIFNFYFISSASAVTAINTTAAGATGNGAFIRNDTLTINVNATLAANEGINDVRINLLSIGGLSNQRMALAGGGTNYSTVLPLTTPISSLNPGAPVFIVTISSNLGIFTFNVSLLNTLFDLQPPIGTGYTARSSNAANPNIAHINDTITVSIKKSHPLGAGDACWVNLSSIGGAPNQLMNFINNEFTFTTSPIVTPGLDLSAGFLITMQDVAGNSVTYRTNEINVDTVRPLIDTTNSSAIIVSGNTIALPGDIIMVRLAITSYDNDTALVICPELSDKVDYPLSLLSGAQMTRTSSSGQGAPATWELPIRLKESDYSGPVTIRVSVKDSNGNIAETSYSLNVDLSLPTIDSATASISDTPGKVLAIEGDTLKIIANLDSSYDIGNVTVTADLSSIGGSAVHELVRKIIPSVFFESRTPFIIPLGSSEDDRDISFVVTAIKSSDLVATKITTPAIRIDNNPPIINSISLKSNSLSGNLTVGNSLTVECEAIGLEDGVATIDLSSIGFGANESLPFIGNNIYRKTFGPLPAFTSPSIGIIDSVNRFQVKVTDTFHNGTTAHEVTQESGDIIVDNEPPKIISTSSSLSAVKIGDSITFTAEVASDPVRVVIDLTGIGHLGKQDMLKNDGAQGNGIYRYTIVNISEGTLDGNNNTFVVTATDDAGNTDEENISITIDNKPINISEFLVDIEYKAGRNDNIPNTINLNKNVTFVVKHTSDTLLNDLGPNGYGTDCATIDLSDFGLLSNQPMTTYGNGSFSYSLEIDPSNFDWNHTFEVTLVDKSGNKSVKESAIYKIDTISPTLISATAVGNRIPNSIRVGDRITFQCQVTENEEIKPTIDLSSFGLANNVVMTKSVQAGSYEHSILMNEVLTSMDNVLASWTITVWDDDQNYVSSYTNEIRVDNKPPIITSFVIIPELDEIQVGDDLTFRVHFAPSTATSVVVDLSAIGYGENQQMTIDSASASITLKALATTTEYLNYKFTATAMDEIGNITSIKSKIFDEVDCRPVGLKDVESGIELIKATEGGSTQFAGIGDSILIWTKASYKDSSDSLIASMSIVDDNGATYHLAPQMLKDNYIDGRYEGLIIIDENWPAVNDIATWQIWAVDNVGNISSTTQKVTSFTIKTLKPAIHPDSYIKIDPNGYQTGTVDLPIFNLASSNPVDSLVASVSFVDGSLLSRAWLDFSEFGVSIPEVPLSLISGNTIAKTAENGVAITYLPGIDNVLASVWLHAIDEAGNTVSTSTKILVDSVAPTINTVDFDGSILNVGLSESHYNLKIENWEIIGSSTYGNTEVLNFLNVLPSISDEFSGFKVTLTDEHKRELSTWSDTPLYLRTASNIATAPLTDLSGNDLEAITAYPIKITDDSWRDRPEITEFKITYKPDSVTLDFKFSKEMDTSSLIATKAVIITAPSNATNFSVVDYSTAYYLQDPTVDTIQWLDGNTRLSVDLCKEGKDWIATKLTNVSHKKLYLAMRSSNADFALAKLGRSLVNIAPENPLEAVFDKGSIPSLFIRGMPNAPHLNIAEKTLTLNASNNVGSDRFILFTDGFITENDGIGPPPAFPSMKLKTPLSNNVTGFHNKITLHDANRFVAFEFMPLSAGNSSEYASSTVVLKLTNDDISGILDLYRANSNPNWGITIEESSFENPWGVSNLAYMPSGNPGAVIVSKGIFDTPVVAAVSMSDKPAVTAKAIGELIFEVEFYQSKIGDVEIPLSSASPTVSIHRQDNNTIVTDGKFLGYSERNIDGIKRCVYRYENTDLISEGASYSAYIKIDNLKDTMGNVYDNITENYSYDLNTKNNSANHGFTDSASAPISIDSKKPEVIEILPNFYIEEMVAGGIFEVSFNEAMDSGFSPILTLASTTHNTITFTFNRWINNETAEFKCDSAFNSATIVSGEWLYQVEAGRDVAGNIIDTHRKAIDVRVYSPIESIVMYTKQPIVSGNKLLMNKPWSHNISEALFSVVYSVVPNVGNSNYIEIYDPITDIGVFALAPLVAVGVNATATVPMSSQPQKTTNYAARIVYSNNNRTDKLLDIIYDTKVPDIASFDMIDAGVVGSYTADAWYYRPQNGDFTMKVNINVSEELHLALCPVGSTATVTHKLSFNSVSSKYELSTGSTLTTGEYNIKLIDTAGNLATSLVPVYVPKKLVANSDTPTVVSVSPVNLGASAIGNAVMRVYFSEPMDADNVASPALYLKNETTTGSIAMKFIEWIDPQNATSAVFVNVDPISSTAGASGLYTCYVSGCRDLAGNAYVEETVKKTVNVHTSGPAADIVLTTNQSSIYGLDSGFRTEPYWNTTHPATFSIDFITKVVGNYDMHIYDIGGVVVATASPIIVDPSGNDNVGLFSSVWVGSTLPDSLSDGDYSVGIATNTGKSPVLNFIIDNTSPVLSTPTLIGDWGNKIATTTAPAFVNTGLIYYYSATEGGDANFTVETTETEKIRMIFGNNTASYTADMTLGNPKKIHNAKWSDFSDIGNIVDGSYSMTVVDYAGNITASVSALMVDTSKPVLSDAWVIDISGNRREKIGAVSAGGATFTFEFNEMMNQNVVPTAKLASSSGDIPLIFTSWTNDYICQFTNTNKIDSTVTPGSYSLTISNARDLAGNTNMAVDSSSFIIEVFSTAPTLTSHVISSRQYIYGSQDLINRPISFEAFPTTAFPTVATLSITYAFGQPYQEPHLLTIYNNANGNMVNSTPVNSGNVAINDGMLGNPAGSGIMASYSFTLTDNLGNISDIYTNPSIMYDGVRPLTTARATSGARKHGDNLYYNEKLHGNLNISFKQAVPEDLVLAFVNVGNLSDVYAYDMVVSNTGSYSSEIVAIEAEKIATGTYVVTSLDKAGNFADEISLLPLFQLQLHVDRDIPEVANVATTLSGGVITSATAGMATFTVKFNEPMSQLPGEMPTLTIASGSFKIESVFKHWENSLATDTAVFANKHDIPNSLAQGEYDCHIIAYDITGNRLETLNGGVLDVRSRGPVISWFKSESFQATTASASYGVGSAWENEILVNQPFSFDVEPGIATITIKLSKSPDVDPGSVWFHFIQNDTTIASSVASVNADLTASFAWKSTFTQLASNTTYTVKVADANDDFSVETFTWTNDSKPPVTQKPKISRCEVFGDIAFLNPKRHTYMTVVFASEEPETPRLRILGANSTDTYDLHNSSENLWSTNFDGIYIRGSVKAAMPDGVYEITMVDRAGNIGTLSDGIIATYGLVIDSMKPVVSDFTLSTNKWFAPAAGNMTISASSTEGLFPAIATGAAWIEIYDSFGVKVNRLHVTSAPGGFTAAWGGMNSDGELVSDGSYTFKAIDNAGNPSDNFISIFAQTSSFAVTGVEQNASNKARIFFNHDIDSSTISGSPAPISITSGLSASNLTLIGSNAIDITVTPAFTHGTSYTFTVMNGIRSIFGAPVDSVASSTILIADAKGPEIVAVNFEGLAGQSEFKVIFSENYNQASAETVANYSLTGAGITVTKAVTQADMRTVILSLDSPLIESVSYTVTAVNIVDIFGNLTSSTSFNFEARDLTPPNLQVSAFSNPANEYDLIVIVMSNEALGNSPTATISQSGSIVMTGTMLKGADSNSYMMGVSLNTVGNGMISISASDAHGNVANSDIPFTIAYLSSRRASVVTSGDGMLTLAFSEGSVKEDTAVRITQHKLEKHEKTGIRMSLQRQLRASTGSLRASQIVDAIEKNHSELVPVTDAYEIGIIKSKISAKGFSVALDSGNASVTTGLGLFQQIGERWNFVSSTRDKKGNFIARTNSSQLFSIMADSKSPDITIAEPTEAFKISRPVFTGVITDASGIKPGGAMAYLDDNIAGQKIDVDADDSFTFTPLYNLVSGRHRLKISAEDNLGNLNSHEVNFDVLAPIIIGQVIQYPNPANRGRMFIHIATNRHDLTDDLVRVKIYDVSGHRVRILDGVAASRKSEKWNSDHERRYVYNVRWDLRNGRGKNVSNGIYFAKIEIRDPDNWSLKVKKTLKLAVLR